jgi:multidrug resistance efflux pump
MDNEQKPQTQLEREEARLATLEAKQACLSAKIKKQRDTVCKLRAATYLERYQELNGTMAMTNAGVTFDEIKTALSSGDLSAIKHKLDNYLEQQKPYEESDGGEPHGGQSR